MLIKKIRIGDLLLQNGKITQEQLEKALQIQRNSKNKQRLGEILVSEGFVSEQEVVELIAKQLNIEVVDFTNVELNFRLLKKIPFQILEKIEAIPVNEIPKYVEVAFVNPMDIDAQTTLSRYLKKPIKKLIAPSKEIKKHIAQLRNREKAQSLLVQMKKELKGESETVDDNDDSATMKFIK